MANRLYIIMKSKKGTTMVEVIAAVAILAMVVLAVLTTISFSQTTILSGSSEGSAAAQAQNIADALITELHTESTATVETETSISGVTVAYVDSASFPNSADRSKDKQFTIIGLATDSNGITGYRIKTAVYYNDKTGRKCIQLTAFSAKDGG
jgi:Tfp pilus assembly protein PilE